MGKNPAFQFYPSDWSRDLEEHPLEIEGAWIRICCKLWWSETRGELTRTYCQWGKILRVDENNAKRIIEYISTWKIGDVSVTGNGEVTLKSRRMKRDETDRENNRLRQERFKDKKRSNANITPPVTPKSQHSSSSSSSSSSKKEKKNKNIYADSVSMTEEEYKKLLADNGEYITKQAITILSNYKLSSGKKYKSDYHAILTWALDKAKGAGNGNTAGRPWLRQAPTEDPEVVSDVEAINARFRAKQMARSVAEKSSIDKTTKDAK